MKFLLPGVHRMVVEGVRTMQDIGKRQIGMSEYTDTKEHTHKVIHSVIFTDEEKRDLEEKIADDLYQIFTRTGKYTKA